MNRAIDVLVVGAGPTGLTLAILLARAGVSCRVIDRASGPSTTSKAIGLQYRVSELLACMGLVDRFLARAQTQTTINIYGDGRLLTRLLLDRLEDRSGVGGFVPRPIILPQSETESLLGQALREAGGAVEWGRELSDLRQEPDCVTAICGGGEVISARYLVSCEGAHSVARKLSGIPFVGGTYPHDFIMADVAMITTLRHGEAHSWLHPDGAVNAISMPGPHRWRLFIEAGPARDEPLTLEAIRSLYRERSGDRDSEMSDPTWLTRFKIHSRMVERFRAGRVFLAGDAAHLHSPSGGQGITTGMQDAYNLAWKLVQVLQQGAPEGLLDSYDEERRPAARAVLATTDRNTKLLFPTTTFGKWVRNRLFMPLLGTRFVQQRLLSRLSQLDMGYRASSVSRSLGRRRLRAGDRAPDVLLRGEPGGESLFTVLGKGRFVALLVGEDATLASGLTRLGIVTRTVPCAGDLHTLYGARAGDVWLIRPDGYIGLCGPASRRAEVLAYLSRFWSGAKIERAFQPALVGGQLLRGVKADARM